MGARSSLTYFVAHDREDLCLMRSCRLSYLMVVTVEGNVVVKGQ